MADSSQKHDTRAHGWAVPNPVPVAGAGLVGYADYTSGYGGGSMDVIGAQFSGSGGGYVAPGVDAGGASGGAATGDTAV